ncbi:hypothetical protein [Thiococcus pfennigii]|uniref:hypothetical protein n=1 Tax=Thiococcus pfennigii TaxID=1057 RepID=UPI00190437F4|nr:hypothetical protein [Thiococcus pfennigii]MBK1699759.1 hypothetical protein [Thiococcus pfennigii]
MSCSCVSFAVRVHHYPTGEEVAITSREARSEKAAYGNALRLLRGRIWAVRAGIRPAAAIVASYDLPDDTPYPNDLIEYRTRAEGPEAKNTEAER